jgi:hypothetical protein
MGNYFTLQDVNIAIYDIPKDIETNVTTGLMGPATTLEQFVHLH